MTKSYRKDNFGKSEIAVTHSWVNCMYSNLGNGTCKKQVANGFFVVIICVLI